MISTRVRTRWPFWVGAALLLAVVALAQSGPAGVALVPAGAVVLLLLVGSFTVLRFGMAATVIASILIPLPLAFKLGPISVSVGRVLGYALLAGWVASLARTGRPRLFRTGLELPLAGYVLVSLASAAVNQTAFGAVPTLEVLRGIAVFAFDFVAFFYVASAAMADGKKVVDYALRAVSAATIGIAVLGLVEKITGRNIFTLVTPVLPKAAANYVQSLAAAAEQVRGGVARIRATTEGPNQLGIILVLSLPLILHYSTVARTPLRRILWLTGGVLCVLAGLFTESRSVIIGFALVLLVYGICTVRSLLALRRAVVIAVALLIMFLSIPQVRNTMIVYFRGLAGFQERSASSRVFQASALTSGLLDHPILGAGPETTSEQQFLLHGATTHITVDDFYVGTLSSVGVLGFIALIGFVGGGLVVALLGVRRAGAQSERSRLAALAAALAAFAALTALFDSLSFYEPSKLYFLLLAATVACTRPSFDPAHRTAADIRPAWQLAGFVRRHARTLAVSAVCGLALGAVLVEVVPDHYAASSIVEVDNAAGLADAVTGGYTLNQLREQMPTYAAYALSDAVLSAAAARIGTTDTPTELRGRLVVGPVPGHLDLEVIASGPTPGAAVGLAGAVASALSSVSASNGSSLSPLVRGTTLRLLEGPNAVRTGTRRAVIGLVSVGGLMGAGILAALIADYLEPSPVRRPARRRERLATSS